jgi:hypothetical protein
MPKVRTRAKQASLRGVTSTGRQTFDELRAAIERLEATHADRAIVLVEMPPNIGASSVGVQRQARKSLLQSLSLHTDGTIWFNVVPGARSGSAGLWSAVTMRVDVSELPRAELPGFVPERVRITEL